MRRIQETVAAMAGLEVSSEGLGPDYEAIHRGVLRAHLA